MTINNKSKTIKMNELHPTQKLKIRSKQQKENFRKINIITKKWDYIIKESMNPNLKNMVKEAFCERKQREPGHGEKKREAETEMETDTQREKTNEYYEDKNAL